MRSRKDREAFERAMREVVPLDRSAGRVAARRRRIAAAAVRSIDFDLTAWGDHQQGLAVGADRQLLRRLELGDFAPQSSLDLHGIAVEEARIEVREHLRRVLRSGQRVTRIIHGRGLRSAAGPVLKGALPGWLAEPPHGRAVLAFTTTGPFGAGGGATVVLLRKRA